MLIAFLFPGQGSQSLGMMTELASVYPTVQSVFAEASEVPGYDLWRLVQDGPEADLNKTTNTRPALLASSVAIWRVWNEVSQIKPVMMAGHSLGEYSALVCSGSLRFTDAIQLVAERGACMQNAVPEGTGSMAAVLGLGDKQIEDACKRAAQGQIVATANYNSLGQTVIAGHKEAVRRALELARAEGARRTVILPVSVPSHCVLMQDAAAQLALSLGRIKFKRPDIPVLQNVDATSRESVEDIKLALRQQLYQPVHWVRTIQEMVRQNIDMMIECGPGKVLSGLVRRIDRNLNILPIFDPESLKKVRAELTG